MSRRWNDSPDGFDAVRRRLEEEDIAEQYEMYATVLESRGVSVPRPYTDAQICALAREHGLR